MKNGDIPREGNASIDEKINSMTNAYAPLFSISALNPLDNEGLVSIERYFKDIMETTRDALPFMNPHSREVYVTKVSRRLSDFIGSERYLGSKEEVHMKRLHDYVNLMWHVIEANDQSYNGHQEQVSLGLHSKNVASLAVSLANAAADYKLGITTHDIEIIRASGILHDVGKIIVPDSILTKNGKLTDQEMARVRPHAEKGAEIILSAGFEEEAMYAGAHHIRPDGKGYPEFPELMGVNTSDIRVYILPFADMFEAITRRKYKHKNPLSPEEAMAVAQQEAGKQLHPDLVKIAVETNCMVRTYHEINDAA